MMWLQRLLEIVLCGDGRLEVHQLLLDQPVPLLLTRQGSLQLCQQIMFDFLSSFRNLFRREVFDGGKF